MTRRTMRRCDRGGWGCARGGADDAVGGEMEIRRAVGDQLEDVFEARPLGGMLEFPGMAPEVEDGSAGKALENSLRDLVPGRCEAASGETKEIRPGATFDRVADVCAATVGMDLNRGGRDQEPIRLARQVQREQLDGADAGEAGVADHLQMGGGVLPRRGAEHRTRAAGHVLEPRL